MEPVNNVTSVGSGGKAGYVIMRLVSVDYLMKTCLEKRGNYRRERENFKAEIGARREEGKCWAK